MEIYEVIDGDTLDSISIKFNISKWKLKCANKLGSDVIFPGTTMRIPDETDDVKAADNYKSTSAGVDDDQADEVFGFNQNSVDPITARLLKFPAQYIPACRGSGDGESIPIDGTMIVTPCVIMFDATDSLQHVTSLPQVRKSCLIPLTELTRADLVKLMSSREKFGVDSGAAETTHYLICLYTEMTADNPPAIFKCELSTIQDLFAFLTKDFDEIEKPSFVDYPIRTGTCNRLLEQLLSKRYSMVHSIHKMSTVDPESPPLLYGTEARTHSVILTEKTWEHALKTHLPGRLLGLINGAHMVYRTDEDGFNIRSLYRMAAEFQDGHNIILITDSNDQIFGALISSAPRVSGGFYGTGESFLFTLNPFFQVSKWTGKNEMFMIGFEDGIGIGAGDGFYGLWIDGSLRSGTSSSCPTYDNTSLCSRHANEAETCHRGRFLIARLELWSFVDRLSDDD